MDAKDKIIAQLQNDNVLLKELVRQLQDRIAVLEKNSSNSSKPPSSDIVKPPRKSTPKDKKLKRGAQKGHKRNPRKPFEENQVDKILELSLEACPTRGGKLMPSNEPPKVHQQVELVDKPFVITEYRQGWYWREHCQCCHAAFLSDDLSRIGEHRRNRFRLGYRSSSLPKNGRYCLGRSSGLLAGVESGRAVLERDEESFAWKFCCG